MPNRSWRDDEENWSETGGDVDNDDLDEEEASRCPECGVTIYSDLDHCPQCGNWLTDADRRSRERGLFAAGNVKLVAAALLVIFALGLLTGLMAM